MPRYLFNPFTVFMLIALVVLLIIVIPLLLFSIIGTALYKLGFSVLQIFLILFLTLIGSFINIPLTTIESRPGIIGPDYSPFFGMLYRIPAVTRTTVVAINVGGALIPFCISLYLVGMIVILPEHWEMLARVVIGIAAVTLVAKVLSRPVRGLGIVTPFFLPPIAALLTGLILGNGFGIDAALIAYVSGTIGTLIGADILNLHRISELGAPLVSIGGAGTFDGVFLTGIIAAFLA
jgi:uncharacterized membrane protein